MCEYPHYNQSQQYIDGESDEHESGGRANEAEVFRERIDHNQDPDVVKVEDEEESAEEEGGDEEESGDTGN